MTWRAKMKKEDDHQIKLTKLLSLDDGFYFSQLPNCIEKISLNYKEAKTNKRSSMWAEIRHTLASYIFRDDIPFPRALNTGVFLFRSTIVGGLFFYFRTDYLKNLIKLEDSKTIYHSCGKKSKYDYQQFQILLSFQNYLNQTAKELDIPCHISWNFTFLKFKKNDKDLYDDIPNIDPNNIPPINPNNILPINPNTIPAIKPNNIPPINSNNNPTFNQEKFPTENCLSNSLILFENSKQHNKSNLSFNSFSRKNEQNLEFIQKILSNIHKNEDCSPFPKVCLHWEIINYFNEEEQQYIISFQNHFKHMLKARH